MSGGDRPKEAYTFYVKPGSVLREDDGYRLLSGLTQVLPCLHGREDIQIGPISGTRVSSGVFETNNKSAIRIRGVTEEEVSPLEGKLVKVGDTFISITGMRKSVIQPHSMLVCRMVSLRDVVNADHMQRRLEKEFPEAQVKVNRKRYMTVKDATITGFGVELDNLTLQTSLRILEKGFGRLTSMGCGVFHPFYKKSS